MLWFLVRIDSMYSFKQINMLTWLYSSHFCYFSDVFFVSDQLSEPSVRPLDSYYGYWSPGWSTVPAPSGPTMSVYGSPRPATQSLATHPSTDTQGPVLLDGLPETTSPEVQCLFIFISFVLSEWNHFLFVIATLIGFEAANFLYLIVCLTETYSTEELLLLKC